MSKKATEQYKQLKKETSRLASMANKRLVRLERNELTELPAYKTWQEHGSIKFSVKGKSYNELQSEFWRVKNFLDNKTSTVREANKVLVGIAKNTGIKYGSIKELKNSISKFFSLANRIKEYYKTANKNAEYLDYQKIWNQINVEIKKGVIDLTNATNIEETLNKFIKALDELEQVEQGKEGLKDNDSKKYDFIKL